MDAFGGLQAEEEFDRQGTEDAKKDARKSFWQGSYHAAAGSTLRLPRALGDETLNLWDKLVGNLHHPE
jgi:hypothetical protein